MPSQVFSAFWSLYRDCQFSGRENSFCDNIPESEGSLVIGFSRLPFTGEAAQATLAPSCTPTTTLKSALCYYKGNVDEIALQQCEDCAICGTDLHTYGVQAGTSFAGVCLL